MSLSWWTSLFFGYSFNEAYHTSECWFIQRRSFFFSSQCSLRGMILEFGFVPYPKLCLYFSTNQKTTAYVSHPSTNKRQLLSFHSLKNYHMLAFWQFIPPYQSWSQVCFSPPMHTWPIESGVLTCPCHLVLIERVEERRPLFPLLILACHYSQPTAGERHLLPPQPGECMRVSYFLVIISK